MSTKQDIKIAQNDRVTIEGIPDTIGTVAGFMGKKVLVNIMIGKSCTQMKCSPEALTVIDSENTANQVQCYHCGLHMDKKDARYHAEFDVYYCGMHWFALQDGKPIKTPNNGSVNI